MYVCFRDNLATFLKSTNYKYITYSVPSLEFGTLSESKIGFENRDPGFELKTETGFQNLWKPVFKEPKIT